MNTKFDFDELIDRHTPGDIKYQPVSGREDVIPMWIADMDFRAPAEVLKALRETAEHGVFGYNETDEVYDEALTSWYLKRQGWEINPEHILKMPGVMFAIAQAIRALTQPGDAILICQPVYHPFERIVRDNDRTLVVSELVLSGGRYEVDFEDVEKRIADSGVKMLLFCSPHNPVGRVWDREELLKIAEICLKHDVWLVSDEIHSDFIYPGKAHIPMASLSEEIAERCITALAPSKTFNIAGLQAANIVIKNTSARKKIYCAYLATGYSELNNMAIAAARAAYLYGEEWLDALLPYLAENISYVRDFSGETKGRIKLIEPEGTYLLWLDCRELGLKGPELEDFFLKKAGVRLNNGAIFGKGGEGFMRMNIATQGSVVRKALNRIGKALER
ncbi:MAG: pyridoxal phosphate-dependent aminotransferase [Lachnospiraceae bacterium]|nr:pyridoxal phosphate-dependent aminotransferase [Lachnospiraceae bacterium]